MKPGESLEDYADTVADDLDHTSRMGGIVDRAYLAKAIAAALKSYGDRRGEEERAKALEGLLPQDGVPPQWMLDCTPDHIDGLAGNPARWPLCTGCVLKAINAALAAAPSGDAKGVGCRHQPQCDSRAEHDAKGTK